jgi:hypothetical protein
MSQGFWDSSNALESYVVAVKSVDSLELSAAGGRCASEISPEYGVRYAT